MKNKDRLGEGSKKMNSLSKEDKIRDVMNEASKWYWFNFGHLTSSGKRRIYLAYRSMRDLWTKKSMYR